MKRFLLAIDMQNDFVEHNGSLYVPNADIAVKNLLKILYSENIFDKIIFTRDAHPYKNISNVECWKKYNGENVNPFTIITYNDIKSKKYIHPFSDKYLKLYTNFLENHSNKKLTLWPTHCIKNTYGYQLQNNIQDYIKDNIDKCVIVDKGTNPKTEHYSIFMAEMPISFDKNTRLNKSLLNTISECDELFICGVATDYCVKESVRVLNDKLPDIMKRTFFIKKCMASISNINIETDEVFHKSIEMGANFI